MPIGQNTIDSIHLLQRGGKYYIPTDSGTGDVGRPRAVGQRGGRIASLETLFDFYIQNVPNPDEAKALNANIEQQLRMHPDVSADFAKRQFSVSAMPWRIERNPRAGDRRTAELIAEYATDVLKNLPNFTKMIETLQLAVLGGGQGIEFTWHQNADGSEVPQQWHAVHMDRFGFDRLGNMALLTREMPVWGVYVTSNPQDQYNRILPHGKFLYHIHRIGQGTWDRPDLEGYQYYGIGEDVPLYYLITFDIYCQKFQMKFIEKYGMPPTVLYYPENRQMSREVVRIADSLRRESVITIPKLIGSGVTDNKNSLYSVETLEVPSGSINFFEDFHEKYVRPRVSCILLGSAEESKNVEGKGGYSEHVSRRDTGPNIWFKRDAANISETINLQLMPPLVKGRFPNCPQSYVPVFTLEPAEEKDRIQEAQIYGEAMKVAPVSEDDYYDVLGIRKPIPGERTLGGPPQQGIPSSTPATGAQNGNGTRGIDGKKGPSAFPGMTYREGIGSGLNGGGGAAGGH